MSELVQLPFLLERYGIARKTLHEWRNNKGFPNPIPSGRQWRLDAVIAWEKGENVNVNNEK